MKVGIVQFQIEPGEINSNLEKALEKLSVLREMGVRLAVLPEMWATGFVWDKLPFLASQMPGILSALHQAAGLNEMTVIGSLPEEDRGKIYNTAWVIDGRSGVIGRYRKIHPFPLTGEDRYFTPGNTLPVFKTCFGQIGIITCYDLRFPELCRSLSQNGARLLLVCAEWPLVRSAHWHSLTLARAIENQCFLIAANCCGSDGDMVFAGDSRIIGPDGSLLFRAAEQECVGAADIDLDYVQEIRSRFDTTWARLPSPAPVRDKILSADSALKLVTTIKKSGKKVVFTNGCFDILHIGHVRYLEQARSLGDFLIVAMNSDESVKSIKGPERPVNNEKDRAEVLAALNFVNAVVLFSEETPYQLIDQLRPDILVKGSDWEEKDIVGGDLVKSYGGSVERIELVEGASTTSLIEKIRTG